MSRCFPFPPPNYCKGRDLNQDLRLTEPIKKEDESLSKEKRKDKRERKEKKDKSEKSTHKDRSHKKQKLDHNDAPPTTSHPDPKPQTEKSLPSTNTYNNKATELIKNKLQPKDEKSVITEEHTLRVITPECTHSSESTENSSKAGSKQEGNNTKLGTLRFKIPLQKHRDQKPAVAGQSSSKIVEPVPVNEAPRFPGSKAEAPKKAAPISQVLKTSPALPANKTPLPTVQAKPKGTLSLPARYQGHAIPKAKVEAPPSSVMKASQPNEAARILRRTPPEPKAVKATPEPSFSGFLTPKRDIQKAPLPRKAIPMPSFPKLEILKAPLASKATPPVPSFSDRVAQRPKILNAPPASNAQRPKILNAPPASNAQRPKILSAPPASKADVVNKHASKPPLPPPTKPKVLPLAAIEAPCFSGRSAIGVSKDPKPDKAPVTALINEAPSSSGHGNKAHATDPESSERRSKRSKKHHRHREDPDRELKQLILNWKPEPLAVHDEEDLGWLFSKPTKDPMPVKASAEVKTGVAISDGKSCAESKLEELRRINPAYYFQPRAQFLPEADMYALPYVVPF